MMISRDEAIKTSSVGVSSYLFFKTQCNFSLKASAGIALTASVLTFLLEKIRLDPKEANNWFECNNKKVNYLDRNQLQEGIKQSKFEIKMLSLQIYIFIVIINYSAFCNFPQRELVSYISKNKFEEIKASLINPFVEEILFRGFLIEWMEVGCDFIDRHIYRISTESQHHISNFAQATLFGALHMHGNNAITKNILTFASTGMIGVICGLWKRSGGGSLLDPIKQHTLLNTLKPISWVPIILENKFRSY